MGDKEERDGKEGRAGAGIKGEGNRYGEDIC
jgi:hypothetical protein